MVHLLDEKDIGVLTAVMSLLVSLVANTPEARTQAYWNCVPKCVRILERLNRSQDIPQEYTYYGIPSPWLQVSSCLFDMYKKEIKLKKDVLLSAINYHLEIIISLDMVVQ